MLSSSRADAVAEVIGSAAARAAAVDARPSSAETAPRLRSHIRLAAHPSFAPILTVRRPTRLDVTAKLSFPMVAHASFGQRRDRSRMSGYG